MFVENLEKKLWLKSLGEKFIWQVEMKLSELLVTAFTSIQMHNYQQNPWWLDEPLMLFVLVITRMFFNWLSLIYEAHL